MEGKSTTLAIGEPLVIDAGHSFVVRYQGADGKGRARIFAQTRAEGMMPWFDRSAGVEGVLLTVRAIGA